MRTAFFGRSPKRPAPRELGRTDGKSSLLLAFNGAVLAGLASVADKDLPPVTKVCGALAAEVLLALAAAGVTLWRRPG
ncbi:hypothetical protein [Streptomyces sp. NPDC054837]